MSSSALAASDHLSKVNAFVSTAGNFIDSALDQLDDQLESAMGGMSEKVGEELKEYSLTAEAMETAKAASTAWSSLGFAALRDEWRDAATEISQKQKDAKSAGRDLAEAARASKREGAGDAENKALLKAMGSEIKRLTERVNLAETAFFSMLNDLDEAPDPSEPLARRRSGRHPPAARGALIEVLGMAAGAGSNVCERIAFPAEGQFLGFPPEFVTSFGYPPPKSRVTLTMRPVCVTTPLTPHRDLDRGSLASLSAYI